MMNLSNLIKLGGRSKSKRVGRGYGSGVGGPPVGKGAKGQKSRSGAGKPWLGFEGGQVPLYKRLPQVKGFRNPATRNIVGVNLGRLAECNFKSGSEITPTSLIKVGILNNLTKKQVKILGEGELKTKHTFKGFSFSKSARNKLKETGSKIIE